MFVYYHQLNPFLIQFSENFGIRWYSLAYIAGVAFAYYAGIFLIRKGRAQLPSARLMDIVVFGAIGAVAGGRLGYCAFYSPQLFWLFDGSFPFWGLLKIHQGGMSSHGGIIGLLASQIFYVYRHKLSFFALMDLAAISGSVGIFFGRIANFINGELYGRAVEGAVWIAVRFPAELYLWAEQPGFYKKHLLSLKALLPSLDSALPDSVRVPGALTWEEWVSKAVEGDAVYGGYVSYISGLIAQSAQKPEIKEILEPLLSPRYPSQIYQALLGGLATFVIVSLVWLKPRKAGLISLIWAFCYLLFRFFTEFYRQPDPQIGFQLFDFTRGQWLSLFLCLALLAYGYFFYRQEPRGFKPERQGA